MTPYWLGVLTGILGTFLVSGFAAAAFIALFRVRVREESRPARSNCTSTVPPHLYLEMRDDNDVIRPSPDIIPLPTHGSITETPERGRGA